MISCNQSALVRVGVEAVVSQPVQRGSYSIAFDDLPLIRPGMSGVTVNLRVGSRAFGWECDHGEPGVSAEGRSPASHLALQVMACLGNPVRVVSGEAVGAQGVVTGKHAFLLIDFAREDLVRISPGDRLLVDSCGQGLILEGHPAVTARNLSPELFRRLPCVDLGAGRLGVSVVANLPAEVMGAGIGMSSEWANCDVMLHDHGLVERLGLADLRLGDLVAMQDQDHRFGRSYQRGWTSVGVVVHALGPTPGHGVGVVTLLTAPANYLEPGIAERANLGDLLERPS
ncbi:MAG: DUF4438 domain-containing protein [Candidatus Dormibacteraeota bacterium]|nr:DUF4438 domain-containing protein [Candidatus Dormibacteraeota bacterium]